MPKFSIFLLLLISGTLLRAQVDYREHPPHLDKNYLDSKQYKRILDRVSRRDKGQNLNMDWARWQAWEKQQAFAPKTGQPEPWQNFGPDTVSGRIISIAFHPSDANTMLAGSASGGLWRSTDYGQSWQPLTDQYPTMGIGAVAYNPQNPNTILIATGEGYGFSNEFTSGFGILISHDAGGTWQMTNATAELSSSFAGMDIAWHPTDTNIVCVATSFGVLYSNDGGHNYGTALGKIGGRMITDPQDPDRLYFVARYYSPSITGGFYMSTNAGLSWTQQTGNGLPSPTDMGFSSITIHPVHNNIIYVAVSQSPAVGSGPLEGLYKSSDFGNSFTEIPTNVDIMCYGPPYEAICLGWYANTILISPADTNTLFAGGTRLRKSTDGGQNWVYCDTANSAYAVHPDHHQTLIHPLTGDLFDCNDGGINYTSDNGNSWTSISDGLITHQFYSIAFAQTDPDVVIGGTQDVGTFSTKTAHSGGGWNNDMSGDAFGHTIDHQDEDTWYGTSYLILIRMKTTNAGGLWESINNGTSMTDQWRMPLVMHPADNQTLLSSNNNFIYRTQDGGDNWQAVYNTGFISTFEYDKFDHDLVYASELYGHDMYRSTDGGSTWETLTSSPGAPGSPITDLAADPWNPGTLYATLGSFNDTNQVFRSTDQGATWVNISDSLPAVPANTIVVDPFDGQNMYVGTDLGVWYSEDAGSTWAPYNDGLPVVVVEDMHFYEPDTTLRMGTYGRGYWRTKAIHPPLPASTKNALVPARIKVHPNPSAGSIRIKYRSAKSGTAHIILYNSLGRQILNREQALEAGLNDMQLDLGDLEAGVYAISIASDDAQVSEKIILAQ